MRVKYKDLQADDTLLNIHGTPFFIKSIRPSTLDDKLRIDWFNMGGHGVWFVNPDHTVGFRVFRDEVEFAR